MFACGHSYISLNLTDICLSYTGEFAGTRKTDRSFKFNESAHKKAVLV